MCQCSNLCPSLGTPFCVSVCTLFRIFQCTFHAVLYIFLLISVHILVCYTVHTPLNLSAPLCTFLCACFFAYLFAIVRHLLLSCLCTLYSLLPTLQWHCAVRFCTQLRLRLLAHFGAHHNTITVHNFSCSSSVGSAVLCLSAGAAASPWTHGACLQLPTHHCGCSIVDKVVRFQAIALSCPAKSE